MMQDIHARYPFLSTTKELVAEDDPNIVDLVSGNGSETLDRALERVQSAIRERKIGEQHPNQRVEVLSYPLARILVSLTDEAVAYSRLARAEADSVRRELSAESTELSKSGRGLTVEGEPDKSTETDRETLLREFEMGDTLEQGVNGSYTMELAAYLPLAVAARDEKWELRHRTVRDGDIHINKNEINDLLMAAVERRVSDGLPVPTPDPVANELTDEVASLRDALDDAGLIRDIDTVAPDLFPPCMSHILEKIRNGEHLEHHARFAITAFLSSLNMSTDEIVDIYTVNPGFAEDMTRYQTDHIQGNTGPIEYSAPACATMKAHGDCYAPDDRCETIKHPMAYYERALDETDDDEIEAWQETVTESDSDSEETEVESDSESTDTEPKNTPPNPDA